MNLKLSVSFAEHIADNHIRDMCSSMAAYGFVHDGAEPREFVVEVFRQSKLGGLQEILTGWEIHGFVHWASHESG